jgi:hypothetical protein
VSGGHSSISAKAEGISLELSINKAVVETLASGVKIFDVPMDPKAEGEKLAGEATLFRITTSDTMDATFAFTTWDQFIPDIRIHSFDSGLEKHERLKSAGRMSVLSSRDGNWLVELTALKYSSEKGRPTLSAPTFEELDYLASQDFSQLMLDLGALRVGPRLEIDQEDSRRKNYPAMVVPNGDIEPILAAFTVTRVLALVKDFGL